MVGGGGVKKTLHIAAKHADISHFAFNPSEKVLNQKLTALKKHCKTVKRDYDGLKKGISVYPIIGYTKKEIETKIREWAQQRGTTLDEWRKRLGSVMGTPEQCIQVMSKYIEKDVNLFTLGFANLEDAKLFAEQIMRKLR